MEWWLGYVAIGATVGFFAGLLGIGGGAIMVPLLAMLFAYYACKLSWQSYTFHDVSTGNDATPLWLPQLAFAAGTVILAIAFIDEFVLELRGERRVVQSEEMLHNE